MELVDFISWHKSCTTAAWSFNALRFLPATVPCFEWPGNLNPAPKHVLNLQLAQK